MSFFEQFSIGERIALGHHTFTADAIKSFARRFDPQPFHIDEAAAARSHFGALCASGWHTATIGMRLWVDHQRRDTEARRARGEAVGRFGPSPGFRDLKWPKPVYAGDTINFSTEIVDKRASASRLQWGLLTTLNTGVNQNGATVFSLTRVVFVERRASGHD